VISEYDFREWLKRVVQEKPPASVIAYNIGLFETPDGYSAYLIGAPTFDEQNGHWACEEVFTPSERYFSISSSESQTWNVVLDDVVNQRKDFWNLKLERTPS